MKLKHGQIVFIYALLATILAGCNSSNDIEIINDPSQQVEKIIIIK